MKQKGGIVHNMTVAEARDYFAGNTETVNVFISGNPRKGWSVQFERAGNWAWLVPARSGAPRRFASVDSALAVLAREVSESIQAASVRVIPSGLA